LADEMSDNSEMSIISLFGNDSFQSGLIFCWHLLLFFFSRDLRAPSADHHKILHHDGKSVQFYNAVQDFGRPSLKKL